MPESQTPPVAEAVPADPVGSPQPVASPAADASNAVATTNGDTVDLTAEGDATATAVARAKAKKKKRRPARAQVDPAVFKGGAIPPQTGTVFNIWYNKWSGGDREDKYISKSPASGRCNIAKDSGYTKADKIAGSYFCLFFARGLCPRGHECEYLHRLPTVTDLFNPNVDVFGRDKFADYRDDMGGVGSFMRQNHTLYVGRIHVSDDIEEVVARHFAEWGQVERIRVLNSRGVAFVTYTNEANAQFAKEAMAHQSLDHSEILNVRWATQDPNPVAQARDKRRVEEQAANAIRAALPAEFVAELEGKDRNVVKKRRIEGSFGLPGYEVPEEVWYARGENAVNPAGRTEGRPEYQMIQASTEPESVKEEGIFSSATLDALKEFSQAGGFVKVGTGLRDQNEGGTGMPLVDYGSDSD